PCHSRGRLVLLSVAPPRRLPPLELRRQPGERRWVPPWEDAYPLSRCIRLVSAVHAFAIIRGQRFPSREHGRSPPMGVDQQEAERLRGAQLAYLVLAAGRDSAERARRHLGAGSLHVAARHGEHIGYADDLGSLHVPLFAAAKL